MRRRDLGWNQRSGYGYGYSSLFFGLGGGQYGGSHVRSGRTERGPVSRRFPSDEILEEEVEDALRRLPEVDLAELRIGVQDRKVTIQGVVPNRDVLDQMTSAILEIDDIQEVDTNDVLILPFHIDQAAG